MKLTIKKLLAISLVTLLVLSLVITILNFVPNIFKKSLIQIDDDEDWDKYIREDLVIGTGSFNDPYIFENLVVVSKLKFGIHISNTLKNFIIRNCSISTSSISISISNVEDSNVLIHNNSLEARDEYGTGIYLYQSDHITVQNNTISRCKTGINLDWCHDISVFNNSITSDGSGVYFYGSYYHVYVNNNSFFYCGIFFYFSLSEIELYFYSENFSLDNNLVNDKLLLILTDIDNLTLTEDVFGQIYLINCSNILLENLNLSKSTLGLQMYECYNITVSSCIFEDIFEIGLDIDDGERISIHNCTFSNTRIGIYASFVSGLNVTYCQIKENYYGLILHLYNKTGTNYVNSVHHNTFINNAFHIDSFSFLDDLNFLMYDSITLEGNYFDNWEEIKDIFPYNLDLYPLTIPPVYAFNF